MDMTNPIADPFVQTGVVAVLGAIITRILLRKYPAWRLVVQLVFFVALTVLLHHYNIIPYEVVPSETPIFERIFIAAAKIIWWIQRRLLLTGCARVFLIFERRPREGRMIQDLVVGAIYLSATLSVVAYVFSAPGRHPDRHIRRLRHHPGPCPAEHAGRRLLGPRAQSQPSLRGRRLDRAGGRH